MLVGWKLLTHDRGKHNLHMMAQESQFAPPVHDHVTMKLFLVCTWLALSLLAAPGSAAEPPVGFPPSSTNTNSQELLRAYIYVQEQLQAAQLAIERNRQEADAAAIRNAQMLSEKLGAMEKALNAQRASELSAMQSANRVMLIVAGTFALAGVAAMLLTAFFQWRSVGRMAEIAGGLPALRALPEPPSYPALGSGLQSAADRSNFRLLDSLTRLERRILELEQTARPALPAGTSGNGRHANDETLLQEPRTLLENGMAAEALAKLDALLKNDPRNAAALVLKGDALEKLRRNDDALATYDQAIESNGALTIAYLQKGALLNRLERFNEALECYELAMRSQEKKRDSSI